MKKEEAMKILKDFHDKSALFSVRTALDTIFPELAESEDERIRKEIISHLQHEYVVKRYVSDVEYDRWIAWLEKQGEQNLASFCRTCKNDALLDLLNKMPSCITVDGLDYHFVMKKTSYYIAYYKGNKEEYSGNAIFGVTAFSPIELLTAMLKKLKKEGLLE